jgi:two-component system, NarL family, nitrate/nitrite response regulator NarL
MRLVLCDDNRILCEALAAIFEVHGHQVLAIATSVDDSVTAVLMHRPDACLMDVRFPDGSGLDAARAIRRSHPDTKILMLSCVADPAVLSEAKDIGAAGFLRKDIKADMIVDALDVIGTGGVAFGPKYSGQASWRSDAPPREHILGALTPRETQVLRRIVAGQSTKQMADEMSVEISTLRSYVKNVLAKLGVHSRLQAAAVASRDPAWSMDPSGPGPVIEPAGFSPVGVPTGILTRAGGTQARR